MSRSCKIIQKCKVKYRPELTDGCSSQNTISVALNLEDSLFKDPNFQLKWSSGDVGGSM